MRKYNFILIPFLVLLAVSCSTKKEEFVNNANLQLVDHLVIPIDSLTKRNAKIMHYSAAEGELCLYNDAAHRLYFFDVTEGDSRKITQLAIEGEHGVSRVDKLYYHSRDSIFVYNGVTHSVLLINDEGKIKEKHQLVDLEDGDPTLALHPALIQYHDDSFYAVMRKTPGTKAEKDKVLLSFDLTTENRTFYADVPQSYYEGRWADKGSERAGTLNSSQDKYVLSFPFDSRIQVVDVKTGEVVEHEASSQLMHEPESTKDNTDIYARMVYLMGNSWYGQIYYDPYQKVYLRAAEVGKNINKGDPIQGKYLSKNNDRVFSVTVVLDENFEKKAEVPNLYFKNVIFSTPESIYIPDRNYEPENEDIIAFAKYKLSPVTP